ncbi:MAG: hypothetical protein ABW110_14630 [Steroidobacteraceae bacterium]
MNLRSGLVLTAAALCLWALYSLLTSLKEPGLLRSQKAAVLKGCEVLTDAEIRQACVPLFCQKALLDAKLVPWDARFKLQLQRPSAADAQFDVVTGQVDTLAPPGSFACVVHGSQVPVRRMVTADQLEELIRAADEAPGELSSS